MMQPVGRLVVLRITPKNDMMGAMAMMVWPALLAPILGPPIGGYITTYLGWPWIFYLNVPLGIAAIAATLLLFPADVPPQRRPFDALGFVLVGAGCFSILYGPTKILQLHRAGRCGIQMKGKNVSIQILRVRLMKDAAANR
jgi:MFS family permease